MSEHPWPEILLADRSRFQLEVFADWLTDRGDELADGIRWVAQQGKRPIVFTAIPMIAWNIRNAGTSHLPQEIRERMVKAVWYVDRDSTVAETHYECLLGAARAYLASLQPQVPPPKAKRSMPAAPRR